MPLQALSDILNNPDGDASPYIPHLEQQPHSRDFRRIYPSEASNAVPTGVAGVSGLLDVGGLMWRAGNQALLGVLACIFRDVQVMIQNSWMRRKRGCLMVPHQTTEYSAASERVLTTVDSASWVMQHLKHTATCLAAAGV